MTPEEMQKERDQMIVDWGNSIELFVKEALGVNLYFPEDKNYDEQQLWVLQDIDNGERNIAIASGHGTGKTALLAWIILWVGLFKYDAKIPVTAPTAPQLIRLLIPEVKKWANVLPKELKNSVNVKQDHISFTTENICVARTARKEAPEGLQGFHATFLAWIIDEASGVANNIFEVIDGSLTGEDYLRIMPANPTRTEGYFYDAFHKNRALWKVHTFNAERSRNVTKESIERKRIQYGYDSDAYRVRVLGQFPRSSSNSVIPLYIIEEALARTAETCNRVGAEVWGVDYADMGDDRTYLAKRVGNDFYDPIECSVEGSHRQVATADWIAFQYNKADRKPKAIFVDAIGEGSGLVSILRQDHYSHMPVIPVKGSSSAIESEIYFNKRSELFFRLKGLLEDEGRMQDNDALIGELSAQKFKISMGGKLQLVSKEDIKEELGRSPDMADAMALCCAEIVVTEEDVEEANKRYHTEFMDDDRGGYDGW